ncbi:MAG TPA: UDP-2,3-diacylglucosamine diphosphatase [Pirellulales bacterium]|jgi:UDP-2,3-diacylglucosamine pyrophosphatase LpxH|nr:UDP-2,3-diacylglucosamine diphosphatase [Pirellulales bacterium]
MYDAIVISDLHLGSEISQAKQLVSFLEMLKEEIVVTRELILNGDVFDSWDFRRLKKNHWKVLSIIRSLSDHVKIVWISGNHDYPEDAATVAQLIGAEVLDRYILESGGKKILVFHGHIFDRFIADHPIITHVVDFFYGILHRIDKSFRLSKWAKHRSKTFLRCSEKIEREAKQLALKLGCDVALCGHTHLERASTDGEIQYYNSGSWCEQPCVYLTVLDGHVEIQHYSPEPSLLEVEAYPA